MDGQIGLRPAPCGTLFATPLLHLVMHCFFVIVQICLTATAVRTQLTDERSRQLVNVSRVAPQKISTGECFVAVGSFAYKRLLARMLAHMTPQFKIAAEGAAAVVNRTSEAFLSVCTFPMTSAESE